MATTTRIDGEFVFTATIESADKEAIRKSAHAITGDTIYVTVENNSVVVEPMRKPGKAKIAEILDMLSELESAKQEAAEQTEQKQRYVTSLYHAEQYGLEHGKPWKPTQHQIDTGVVPAGFEGEFVCYVYK